MGTWPSGGFTALLVASRTFAALTDNRSHLDSVLKSWRLTSTLRRTQFILVTDQNSYPKALGTPEYINYIVMYPGAHPICVHTPAGELCKWWFYSVMRCEEQLRSDDTVQPLTPEQLEQIQSFDLSKKDGQFCVNRRRG